VAGVVTQMGLVFRARSVVLTVGTFLAGRVHVGPANYAAGRAGDPPAQALALRLRELLPRTGRLKTGTPPRLDGRSIDFDRLEVQPGDDPVPVFSFLGTPADHPRQVACHITRTTARTHDIIRAGLDRSPLFSGAIAGVGPRYCPSIEDKVVRFAERDSHQIFVEPEGLDTVEVYPNGISTSLPFDVQYALVRSIPGFEQARIVRPGYAIEYDYFDPRDLRPTLETRSLGGLFCAGQINGTTGYEEAAAQGLLAGLNAARQVAGRDPWWPRRDQAYLGVLVDDLINLGTSEPYRMFTSRAEYRLLLREDNADQRLTPVGRRLGLVDDARWAAFTAKQAALDAERQRLAALPVTVGSPAAAQLDSHHSQPLTRDCRALDLLRRPGIDYAAVVALPGLGPGIADPVVAEQLWIDARYAGYVERQRAEIDKARRYEAQLLPAELDYAAIHGLSSEVRQKLAASRPATLGQAARIPGVTPAAVSLLLVHLKRLGQLRRTG
jgi:tRNA uridine 5-carboxymethylaminomethyl modification enzyme